MIPERRRKSGMFYVSVNRQAVIRNKTRCPEDYEPTIHLETEGEEGWENIHMLTWEGSGRLVFARTEKERRPTGAHLALEIKGRIVIWSLEDMLKDDRPN